MSDESYVKPAWCGTDYIAKVRGREGGREREEKGEREERGRSLQLPKGCLPSLPLSAQCSSDSMAGAD